MDNMRPCESIAAYQRRTGHGPTMEQMARQAAEQRDAARLEMWADLLATVELLYDPHDHQGRRESVEHLLARARALS